ncbi:protein phosphatase 2C domain-containing protein [Candidatus Uhrbacteria bacterium]|nr:protein phosphatase 2C domain-containing protein [Candidatus Uhrbacteria bacterium]
MERPTDNMEAYLEIEPDFEMAVESETVASPKHPDRNEDKVLGQPDRTPPKLETDMFMVGQDQDKVREWSEREQAAAETLAKLNIYGLFDGVSGEGAGAGAIASRISSGAIAERLAEMPPEATAEETAEAFRKAVEAAHREVQAHKKGRDDLKGGGATVDLVRLIRTEDSGYDLAYAHAGDSRIYVLDSETGMLEQLTEDEGPAFELLKQGYITKDQYRTVLDAENEEDIPGDQNFKLEGRTISLRTVFDANRQGLGNAIGKGDSVTVTTGVRRLKAGDRVYVMSDGVSDNVDDNRLAEMADRNASAEEIRQAAYDANVKPDDISLVKIEVGGREGGENEEYELNMEDVEFVASPEERTARTRQDSSETEAALESVRKTLK